MFCLVLVCSGTWTYLFIIRRMVIISRHPGLCFPLPLSAGSEVAFISLKMPMTGSERTPPHACRLHNCHVSGRTPPKDPF